MSMSDTDFEIYMKNLRRMKTGNDFTDYFNNNQPSEHLSESQKAIFYQRLKSIFVIEEAKTFFNLPLDYSNQSIAVIDIMVDAVTDLQNVPIFNIPFDCVERITSLRNGHLYNKGADQLFGSYINERLGQIDKSIKLGLMKPEDPVHIDQLVLGVYYQLIDQYAAYLGEAYISNYGGFWDCERFKNNETDYLSITNNNQEISFYQTVYNRFFKSNLPIFTSWEIKTTQ